MSDLCVWLRISVLAACVHGWLAYMMGEDAFVLGGRFQRSGYYGQRLVRERSRERGMGGMALFVSVGWILAAAVAFGLSRRVAAWAVGRSCGQPHGNGRQTRD